MEERKAEGVSYPSVLRDADRQLLPTNEFTNDDPVTVDEFVDDDPVAARTPWLANARARRENETPALLSVLLSNRGAHSPPQPAPKRLVSRRTPELWLSRWSPRAASAGQPPAPQAGQR